VTSTAPEPAPADAGSAPPTDDAGRRVDLRRLSRADVLVTAGAVLFGVLAVVPWFRTEAFDLGFGHRAAAVSARGLDSGLVVTALVLLVLAGGWSLLPAVAEVPTPFPRELLTAGLAVLAFLLVMVEWLTTLDLGVSVAALLALLTVAAVLTVAVRALLPPARAWVAAERTPEDVT
jgi:hypothetical protein